jgi:Protein of unknown function (DUF2934)
MATAKTARVKNGKEAEATETLNNQTVGLIDPSREEIERRAYELYVARGEVDGYDQEDWLQAERELKEAQS